MIATTPSGSPPESDHAHRTLARVAASLGCTVDALLTGEGLPTELAQGVELRDLWLRLQTNAQREAVLRAVRELVERSGH